jgi:hypothetical protein
MVRFCDGGEIDFGTLGKWPKAALRNKEIQELITSRYDAQSKGLEEAITAIENKRAAFMTVKEVGDALWKIIDLREKKSTLIRNFERYLKEV